jgi:predicted HNH restriction endonuclease
MRHRGSGRLRPPSITDGKGVAERIKEMRRASQPSSDYREQSLKIHGLICAKCGREFEEKNRHLLTVHHKDGNHRNNPPDGSNWENLCVYCHEDEHSRTMLGDYLREGK